LPTYVEEFRGLQEIVFVILFDNAEFLRLRQRAEVDGCGINGRGDVFEFEAEGACGHGELADVAD
jgi:hypothetical protein